MQDQRPVNLNLLTIRFPVTAIVSILHRISGVVLFLALPFMLWMLDVSLQSAESFDAIGALLDKLHMKLIVWVVMSAALYHVLAGIRHLFMDYGWFGQLQSARRAAYVILALFVILALEMGVWLWS